MFNPFIIDFGLGHPADIAYVKTIGSFADGDRCLSDPQPLITMSDSGCFPILVILLDRLILPLPPAKKTNPARLSLYSHYP